MLEIMVIGLYFVFNQGINTFPNVTTNSTAKQISLPIAFPNKNLASILSDTTGNIAAITGNDEGARLSNRWTNAVNYYSAWNNGLDNEITIVAFGY